MRKESGFKWLGILLSITVFSLCVVVDLSYAADEEDNIANFKLTDQLNKAARKEAKIEAARQKKIKQLEEKERRSREIDRRKMEREIDTLIKTGRAPEEVEKMMREKYANLEHEVEKIVWEKYDDLESDPEQDFDRRGPKHESERLGFDQGRGRERELKHREFERPGLERTEREQGTTGRSMREIEYYSGI